MKKGIKYALIAAGIILVVGVVCFYIINKSENNNNNNTVIDNNNNSNNIIINDNNNTENADNNNSTEINENVTVDYNDTTGMKEYKLTLSNGSCAYTGTTYQEQSKTLEENSALIIDGITMNDKKYVFRNVIEILKDDENDKYKVNLAYFNDRLIGTSRTSTPVLGLVCNFGNYLLQLWGYEGPGELLILDSIGEYYTLKPFDNQAIINSYNSSTGVLSVNNIDCGNEEDSEDNVVEYYDIDLLENKWSFRMERNMKNYRTEKYSCSNEAYCGCLK